MDPDENLREQLALARSILRESEREDSVINGDDAARLCELVQALHTWIANGGFLPAAWAGPEHLAISRRVDGLK